MYILNAKKMNKKYLYLIIIILSLVIISLLSYERSETYVFKSDNPIFTHNFGTIEKEKKFSAEIETKYINQEFESLKVYDVKDGCDCTKSRVKPGIYKRNSTINIKTIYYPTKYKDSGNIIKQLFLVTNKKNSKNDTLIPINITGVVK
jgi:hypothetical protein